MAQNVRLQPRHPVPIQLIWLTLVLTTWAKPIPLSKPDSPDPAAPSVTLPPETTTPGITVTTEEVTAEDTAEIETSLEPIESPLLTTAEKLTFTEQELSNLELSVKEIRDKLAGRMDIPLTATVPSGFEWHQGQLIRIVRTAATYASAVTHCTRHQGALLYGPPDKESREMLQKRKINSLWVTLIKGSGDTLFYANGVQVPEGATDAQMDLSQCSRMDTATGKISSLACAGEVYELFSCVMPSSVTQGVRERVKQFQFFKSHTRPEIVRLSTEVLAKGSQLRTRLTTATAGQCPDKTLTSQLQLSITKDELQDLWDTDKYLLLNQQLNTLGRRLTDWEISLRTLGAIKDDQTICASGDSGPKLDDPTTPKTVATATVQGSDIQPPSPKQEQITVKQESDSPLNHGDDQERRNQKQSDAIEVPPKIENNPTPTVENEPSVTSIREETTASRNPGGREGQDDWTTSFWAFTLMDLILILLTTQATVIPTVTYCCGRRTKCCGERERTKCCDGRERTNTQTERSNQPGIALVTLMDHVMTLRDQAKQKPTADTPTANSLSCCCNPKPATPTLDATAPVTSGAVPGRKVRFNEQFETNYPEERSTSKDESSLSCDTI